LIYESSPFALINKNTGGKMGILKTAIKNKRWDLAAHVLLLAALQVLASQRIVIRANVPNIGGDTKGGLTDEIGNLGPEK
jgi:hypothetical protein